jgi:pyridoxal phosphate enzyme (YggS family)
MTMISRNLQSVQHRIVQACNACGSTADAPFLLAVSKTFGPDAVRAAFAAGQVAFGENYIQEGVDKIAALRDLPLEWHCIGPVQSNKTRLVAENFDWVHSVDRLKIAERLSAQRPAEKGPLQVCIQVNVDGSESKSGVAPADVAALAHAITQLPRLQLRGLMTIPAPAPDFAAACAVHRMTRTLFDALRADGLALDTLSMGMSADLEAAVQCGSTLLRVGSAIFGGRPPV